MYRIYIDKKVKNCIVLKDKKFLPLCLYMYDYKIKNKKKIKRKAPISRNLPQLGREN